MRSFTDVLDDPSVIGIENEWVPADYNIEAYVVEIFDGNDQRIWRVSSMPTNDSFVEFHHSLHYDVMNKQHTERMTVLERLKLLAIRIRNFYLR